MAVGVPGLGDDEALAGEPLLIPGPVPAQAVIEHLVGAILPIRMDADPVRHLDDLLALPGPHPLPVLIPKSQPREAEVLEADAPKAREDVVVPGDEGRHVLHAPTPTLDA